MFNQPIRNQRRVYNNSGNGNFPRNQGPNQDDQFVLEGQVKPTRSGGESIVFRLDLGFIRLSFIVTVPSEDTETGPVYVKYQFNPSLRRKWFDPNFRPDSGFGQEDMEHQLPDETESVG